MESETVRPVPLSSAIHSHNSVLTGRSQEPPTRAICHIMLMSCAQVDRKKP